VTSDSPPLDRARNVVRRFLEAASWKDRVGLIAVPGDPARRPFHQLLRAIIRTLRLRTIDWISSTTKPGLWGGGAAYFFFLTFANEVDGFPVMVMESNGEFRLDWNLYMEFRERAFQRFLEEQPEEPGRFGSFCNGSPTGRPTATRFRRR